LLGVKSEKASRLLEAILEARVDQIRSKYGGTDMSEDQLYLYWDKLRFKFESESDGYHFEDEINDKLGVGFSDLYLVHSSLRLDLEYSGAAEGRDRSSYI